MVPIIWRGGKSLGKGGLESHNFCGRNFTVIRGLDLGSSLDSREKGFASIYAVVVLVAIAGGIFGFYSWHHNSQAQEATVQSLQDAGLAAKEAEKFQDQYGDSFIFPWEQAETYDSSEEREFLDHWAENPEVWNEVLEGDLSQTAAEEALHGDADGDGVQNYRDSSPFTADPILKDSTDLGLSENLAIKLNQEISAAEAEDLLRGLENMEKAGREEVAKDLIQDGKVSDAESYALSSFGEVTVEKIQDVRNLAGDYGLENARNLIEKYLSFKEENADLAEKYLNVVTQLKGNAPKAVDRLDKLGSYYSEDEVYGRVLQDGEISAEDMGNVEFGIQEAVEGNKLPLDRVFNPDNDPIHTYFEMKHSREKGGIYNPLKTNDVYLLNFSDGPTAKWFYNDLTDKFIKELSVPESNIVEVLEDHETPKDEASWETLKGGIDNLAPRVDKKDFVFTILDSHGGASGLSLSDGYRSWSEVGKELNKLEDARANFRYINACGGSYAQDAPSLTHEGVVLVTPTRTSTGGDHLNSLYGVAFNDPSMSFTYTRCEKETKIIIEYLENMKVKPPYSVKKLYDASLKMLNWFGVHFIIEEGVKEMVENLKDRNVPERLLEIYNERNIPYPKNPSVEFPAGYDGDYWVIKKKNVEYYGRYPTEFHSISLKDGVLKVYYRGGGWTIGENPELSNPDLARKIFINWNDVRPEYLQ